MPQKADAEKYRKRKTAKEAQDTSFNTQPNILTHKGKKGKDESWEIEKKNKKNKKQDSRKSWSNRRGCHRFQHRQTHSAR